MDSLTLEELLREQNNLEYLIFFNKAIVDQTRKFFIKKYDEKVEIELTTINHLDNSKRKSKISVKGNDTTYHNLEFMSIDKIHVNNFFKDLREHCLGKSKIFYDGVKIENIINS